MVNTQLCLSIIVYINISIFKGASTRPRDMEYVLKTNNCVLSVYDNACTIMPSFGAVAEEIFDRKFYSDIYNGEHIFRNNIKNFKFTHLNMQIFI